MAAKKRKSRKSKSDSYLAPFALLRGQSVPLSPTYESNHIEHKDHKANSKMSSRSPRLDRFLRYVIFVFFVVIRLSTYGSADQKENGRKKAQKSQK